MDFQNVNPLNVKLNILSGNLLPMTSDNSSFPIVWKMYSIVIWLIELIQTSATICGYVSVANSDTLQDSGTVSFVVSIQVFILLTRMYASRDLASQLIQKFNSFLRSEDESIKSIVNSTMKPLEIPLEFYSIGGTASVILWCCLPFFLIIKKKYFFYEDYAMIAAFSKQPFSTNVFVLGNIMEGISSGYMFLKKVAIDIYMINIVMLMTAQYRYVAVKLATILRNDASEENENCEFQKERSLLTEKKMKALCRHYNTVILTMLTLKKFLSLNMSYIYLNNIVLFCFIDVLIVNIIVSRAYLQVPVIVMYLCGTLIQLYIMCFCIHQLLDASKEVTDEAFHEKWYQFGPSLKYMFRMIMMANNLNSKFSITEKFSLSLPSFLSILNQSYSIALLLLKMK